MKIAEVVLLVAIGLAIGYALLGYPEPACPPENNAACESRGAYP